MSRSSRPHPQMRHQGGGEGEATWKRGGDVRVPGITCSRSVAPSTSTSPDSGKPKKAAVDAMPPDVGAPHDVGISWCGAGSARHVCEGCCPGAWRRVHPGATGACGTRPCWQAQLATPASRWCAQPISSSVAAPPPGSAHPPKRWMSCARAQARHVSKPFRMICGRPRGQTTHRSRRRHHQVDHRRR